MKPKIHFSFAVLNFLQTKFKLQNFRLNAVVKFNSKKIAIKTERDVEIRLQVKQEPKVLNKATKPEKNGWEKEKLVEQIVSLKTENQRNHLAFKKKELECAKILREKQNLEQKLSENDARFSLQLNELRSELINAKHEIVAVKTSSGKIISDLKRENQVLLARNKQLQTGIHQRKSANINTEAASAMENSFAIDYEVEKIIAHKNTKAGRKYKIRWKGYDSDDDTWEKATNLNCPEILCEYLDTIGNKKNN